MPYNDKQRKQYFAIKNALTNTEKDLISLYELNWHLKQYIPTISELHLWMKKKHPSITQVSINYYLNRQPVIKALEQRGIPFRQHTQEELTSTQIAAAITMANFADERTAKEKLDEMGINPQTYYTWLNDPNFQALVEEKANQNLKHIKPTAINEFTRLITQGHWPAIKHYMETTGTLNNNDAPQSEVLIRMIIEIIQKHVKDPETIVAIAQDIKLASANRTLEVAVAPPAITSTATEVTYDPELEAAKRKVGF